MNPQHKMKSAESWQTWYVDDKENPPPKSTIRFLKTVQLDAFKAGMMLAAEICWPKTIMAESTEDLTCIACKEEILSTMQTLTKIPE